MDRDDPVDDRGRPETDGGRPRALGEQRRPDTDSDLPGAAGSPSVSGIFGTAGDDPGVGEHLPEGVLAALALDGVAAPTTPAARGHLESCVRCRAELTDLREIVSAARGAGAADASTVAPPPRVWDAIADELDADTRAPGPRDGTIDPLAPASPSRPPAPRGADGAGEPGGLPGGDADEPSRGGFPFPPHGEPVSGDAVGSRRVGSARNGAGNGQADADRSSDRAGAEAPPRAVPGTPGADGGPGADTGAVPAARSGPSDGTIPPPSPAPLPGPRRRPLLFAVAASLVVGVLLGSAGTWWQMSRDGDPAGTPSVEYAAEYVRIDPPEGVDLPAVGRIRLDGAEEAGHVLVISVRGLPETTGYFEVWLMDESAGGLIPIGVLDGDGTAALPLPHGVDLGEYAVVDVSEEPFNGSPEHSGRSVVRGPLRT
ncbi:anti-sigma factor [Streptomyces sp. ST2-7A]|uniref:anti-sigma factor n=1 Tax=Streptomyces sp. ST2-7A TaxID=2907214 RepID=UPI001F1BAF21|nr:anti-sigma factor [Streptomyces sp. ST2-7A]MCE7080490.1 anti-sigma factor [Streptomyces sp. ST2-7A]